MDDSKFPIKIIPLQKCEFHIEGPQGLRQEPSFEYTAPIDGVLYFKVGQESEGSPVLTVSDALPAYWGWDACRKISSIESGDIEVIPLIGPAFVIATGVLGECMRLPIAVHYEGNGVHLFNTEVPFVLRGRQTAILANLFSHLKHYWRVGDTALGIYWDGEQDEMSCEALALAYAALNISLSSRIEAWIAIRDDEHWQDPENHLPSLPKFVGKEIYRVRADMYEDQNQKLTFAEHYLSIECPELPEMCLAVTRVGCEITRVRLITVYQCGEEIAQFRARGFEVKHRKHKNEEEARKSRAHPASGRQHRK